MSFAAQLRATPSGLLLWALTKSPKYSDEVPAARRLSGIPLAEVLKRTADYFGVEVADYATTHRKQPSRDVAAWLVRRLTVATLRDLASPFGLGHPDSVRGLLVRAETAMNESPKLRKEVDQLRGQLLQGAPRTSATRRKKNTNNGSDPAQPRRAFWSAARSL